MRSDPRVRFPFVLIAFTLTAVVVLSAQPSGPRFFPDDPILVEDDRHVDVRGADEIRLDDYYDFIENTFLSPGDRRRIPAVNVNTLDEVPDSSWFTNRTGREAPSLETLTRGPDRPVRFSDQWTIVRGKNRGFHPGFRAYDRSDPTRTVYQLEVDPPTHPEMASGAEVIGAGFYHAFGFNTVEVYLATIDPAALRIHKDATIRDASGRRPFDARDLAEILDGAARLPDGRIRVSAERLPDEADMGRFEYHGTRPDDPNDIHPHEHRRELRGSRVFAAWLNHDDSRALNTLVLRHRENGRRFFKYYIVDFGSALGSATRFADVPQSGREHALTWRPSLLTFATLGLWTRPWLRQPPPSSRPAVGRFTAEGFDPARWVAEYPKAAYDNMRADDAFWAARIVAAFGEPEIRAIVGRGRFSDPGVVDELTEVLLDRRRRILETWLTAVTPITTATLANDGVLTFDNVAVRHGIGGAPIRYDVTWSIYDNDRRVHTPIGNTGSVTTMTSHAPESILRATAGFVSVRIEAVHPTFPGWRPVQLYFRREGAGWRLAGLDRGLPFVETD